MLRRGPYDPYDSDSDSSSDSGSTGTESTGTSSEDRLRHDGRLSAADQWRTQGAAWIGGPSRFVVPDGPGAPNNGIGLYNTAFTYAEERRVSVLMLDSLDRDQAVYPMPTSLRLKLPRVYRNVERIDICQVKFLNGIYAIAAARGTNTLTVDVSSGRITAVLPDGTYTGQQLVDAIAASAVGAAGVSVTYSCPAGRFIIALDPAAGPLSLPWASAGATGAGPTDWGLGWLLGFGGPPVDMAGSASYMASHMPRLSDDYVFLRLNDSDSMNDVDHTSLEDNDVAQDSTGEVHHYFGKLLLNHFGCWSQTFVEAPKQFRPVLGRLERLSVDWVDRHGQPLLTGAGAGTCDWHMTVRITEIVEGPAATSSLVRAGPQISAASSRG